MAPEPLTLCATAAAAVVVVVHVDATAAAASPALPTAKIYSAEPCETPLGPFLLTAVAYLARLPD